MSEAPKHPSLTLEEPQEGTLEQLRRLNSVVFPVSYSNRFYDAVMACPMLSSLGALSLSPSHTYMHSLSLSLSVRVSLS